MTASNTFANNTLGINDEVEFLSHPESYSNTTKVEVIETHMSWVFLTDRYAYKLKKPVIYDFLDFSTREARYKYCVEEVSINQALAANIYIDVLSLNAYHGQLKLKGDGESVDWLVMMMRLPKEHMLDVAIKEGTVRNELLRGAAEKLVDFYRASAPIPLDVTKHRRQMMKEIELNAIELQDGRLKLSNPLIHTITSDLLRFMINHAGLFEQRVAEGRIIDAHGDLRPEHICLGREPVFIDRLEFDPELRILDIAEELSFLVLECDMLAASAVGQLFLTTYEWSSRDKIPDMLIYFYAAKRAFLRAKLSIYHLLEMEYFPEKQKWRDRCSTYLNAANTYCLQLPKE